MTRRTLLSTPLFDVEHRTYPGPGDGRIERDVVLHPGAVVVLPVLSDGRIVLIRNYRHAVESELWELPAGTREPGEDPIDTALYGIEHKQRADPAAARHLDQLDVCRQLGIHPPLIGWRKEGVLALKDDDAWRPSVFHSAAPISC